MTRHEHLLTILAEECAEVAQRVSKALRFGPLEVQPGQDKTNAERIVDELIDLKAVWQLLGGRFGGGVVLPKVAADEERRRIEAKAAKVERYLAFSAGRGLVDGVPADPTVPHPEAT